MPRNTTDSEVSDLLLRACHDLKSPARTIRSYAELLSRDTQPGAEFAERLGYLVGGARQIDKLVDALASYALALRVDAASFRETVMEVLLRNVLARLAEPLRTGNAVVTYDPLPRLRGDPDRLLELWLRLIDNALLHCGAASPHIHIAAVEQDGNWRFSVKDNGAGVPPDFLERMFRPFERGSSHHTGAGMGLAIAKAIVEHHGGAIWAESGSGTTIFFTLPAT